MTQERMYLNESIEWILFTLYGGLNLPVEQFEELGRQVEELVLNWSQVA